MNQLNSMVDLTLDLTGDAASPFIGKDGIAGHDKRQTLPKMPLRVVNYILASAPRLMGHALRERGRHTAALSWFRLADKIAPEFADITGHIGASLVALGRFDEGRRWLLTSNRAQARHGHDLLCSAHCFARLGDIEHAAASFQRAVDLAPTDPRVLSEAANYFRTVDRLDEARVMLNLAVTLAPDDPTIAKAALALRPRNGNNIDRLHFVTIGTTGQCNASCQHCPTGKIETQHVPRYPMSMKIFCRLIDELKNSGLPIVEGIAFGLFGDALLDPHVVERAAYVNKHLPDVPLVINTNGAAYDRKKHAELAQFLPILNLHCESLRPEVYDNLMTPLRAKRVQAKYAMIMEDFPDLVKVTMPISRKNHADRTSLQDYFLSMGAIGVTFHPLSARSARDQSAFDRLAFDPQPIRCSTDLFYNLTIDCDGSVVACCNDFSREVPLGDANEQSLELLLQDPRRLAMAEAFRQGRHHEYSPCSRCRADVCIPA